MQNPLYLIDFFLYVIKILLVKKTIATYSHKRENKIEIFNVKLL